MSKEIISIKVTLYKGELPEMGATDWWTKKDWQEHNDYVEWLKAKGEYLQPEEITISYPKDAFKAFEYPEDYKPENCFKNFGILMPSVGNHKFIKIIEP